jgi:pimeloyl-ACP methyl ester carboxylesterase
MHQTTNAPVAPPPRIFGLIEGPRAASEYGWFLASRRWLAKGRSGAGRPVLVLPGLEAADWSTKPLRNLLSSVGYHAYGWGLGRNVGPTDRIITGLDEVLLRIRDSHGAPVSVVGQSLGGSLGRELARRHPGAVDRLISLGCPVTITDLRQSRAGKTYLRYASEHLPQYAFERWAKAPQPPIPSTSIYSRSDGVVQWNACRYSGDPLTENIEVHASHFGLGVHPAALYAVLDRLEVPVSDWARFAPRASLRAYFPTLREEARG